ncbi:hypothetical protein BC628DRAFT_351350 [Trametes gibbosa]|nr:hypothetical protein BC628DRAFT_351350 [Trametes gibbosa]
MFPIPASSVNSRHAICSSLSFRQTILLSRMLSSTIICATFTNGKVTSTQDVTGSALLHTLTSQPRRIQKLRFSAIHVMELQPLLSLLETSRMSSLKELDIMITHPVGMDTIVPSVPMLDLPATRYPTLQVLRLDGVATNIDTPFLPTLRHLVLKNYPGVEKCLILTDFLLALSRLPYLEKLELSRFSNIFATHGQQRMRPVTLPSLKELIISESLEHTSKYLQHLCTSSTTNTHATIPAEAPGKYDFGRTFDRMLPKYKSTIPVLQQISYVEVNIVDGSTYQLFGMTALGATLVLEIDMSIASAHESIAPAYLYESVVRNLDKVLSHSPVIAAVFNGDLSHMRVLSWHTALQALPQLTKLTVIDSAEHNSGVRTLCKALAEPAAASDDTRKHVCQQLEVLCTRGAAYGCSLLDEVADCLVHRKSSCATLKSLSIQLRGVKARDDEAPVMSCKAVIASLVKQCSLQILS